jgi:hypothetical protein
MSRRPTVSELALPLDEAILRAANEWAKDGFLMMLEWVWEAWDRVQSADLSRVNFQQPLEEVERDLTSNHAIWINRIYARETGGYCAVTPQHEYPERESRPPPPGRSPAYDLAFVWRENSRIAWAIEAKVLKTDRNLAPYERDVTKFLSGKAAPFVCQGGIIAYLISGNAEDFHDGVRKKLRTKFDSIERFPTRPHRSSKHRRKKHPELELHHMVMECCTQMNLQI